MVDSLCPLPHLFRRVRITCLACCSVATDGRASISCHHDVSSPSCIHVSASFRATSTLSRIPITVIIGSIGFGAPSTTTSCSSPLVAKSSGSTSMSIPFTSRCACLVEPFSFTLPLLLSSFIISDSSRFSESGGCGASSAPLPHRPVSIPSLSHSASPLRKPSKSALSARTRFRGHSHGALPDVPGPANRLSSRHSHFVGSHTALRSMRPSA